MSDFESEIEYYKHLVADFRLGLVACVAPSVLLLNSLRFVLSDLSVLSKFSLTATLGFLFLGTIGFFQVVLSLNSALEGVLLRRARGGEPSGEETPSDSELVNRKEIGLGIIGLIFGYFALIVFLISVVWSSGP